MQRCLGFYIDLIKIDEAAALDKTIENVLGTHVSGIPPTSTIPSIMCLSKSRSGRVVASGEPPVVLSGQTANNSLGVTSGRLSDLPLPFLISCDGKDCSQVVLHRCEWGSHTRDAFLRFPSIWYKSYLRSPRRPLRDLKRCVLAQ